MKKNKDEKGIQKFRDVTWISADKLDPKEFPWVRQIPENQLSSVYFSGSSSAKSKAGQVNIEAIPSGTLFDRDFHISRTPSSDPAPQSFSFHVYEVKAEAQLKLSIQGQYVFVPLPDPLTPQSAKQEELPTKTHEKLTWKERRDQRRRERCPDWLRPIEEQNIFVHVYDDEEVGSSLHLPDIDRELLDFWKTENVFQKSIDRPATKGDFVFYDGPPGTNGVPHVGHMMQSALKDLWPRFKTMQGYRVLRKAGWDTHGLPVELTADKELGYTSKRDVVDHGIQHYIDYCRKTVFRYKGLWEEAITKVGRFVDLDHAYATYQPYYIQADWWTLKQAWNLQLEGEAREFALKLGQSPRYLYRDYRVMAYSPRTGTTLSNFEVAQGYKDVTDLTLFVKFRVKGLANTYLTAWTTTPWTLLSNMAVAVGPEIEYITVELLEDCDAGKTGERMILAHARHQAISPMLGKHHIVGHHKGSELAGTAYEPMWEWLPGDHDTAMHVVADDYVTTEDGTGLVHLAYYGEDDFRILRKNGIPLTLAVGPDGLVQDFVTPFAGRWFREDGLDVDILKALKAKNLLIGKQKYDHAYPFDYRTHSPLMYFPRPAWFVRTTALKEMMLTANEHIGWKPDHIRDGRFGNWLENVTDWNVTRERYWGSPLPIWQTEDGSEAVCVESLAELERLVKQSGGELPADFDPHKPQIDQIVLKSADGRDMRRDDFVLDSWFNAGLMPWGQWGFPAEPGSTQAFRAQYPADFICEGLDQTRGWFYTMLACSCLIAKGQQEEAKQKNDSDALKFWSDPHNWSSYKNVICTELVLDHEGRKMSKSIGNVVDPIALFDKFGADPVRWIFYSSNPWNSKRFGEEEIGEAVRSVILPLWNSYSFFVTYALIDSWQPAAPAAVQPTLMDRWIVSEYHRMVETVTAALDVYDVATAATAITRFLDLLTNWYIRRSRRRFWKSESDADKTTAYATLYGILEGLSRTLAPFLPFLSEHIYQNLVCSFSATAPVSVHLADYPQALAEKRDLRLEAQMERVMEAVTLARALRQERNLKVRQPLASLIWVVPDESTEEDLAPFLQIIADELNVKEIKLRHDDRDLVTRTATANFKVLGKRVGGRMQEVAKAIGALSDADIQRIEAGQGWTYDDIQLNLDDIQIRRTEQAGMALKSDGYMTVALDTELTAELEAEGLAREVVHHLQNLRKQSGFEITDRIAVEAATPSHVLTEAIRSHRDYICRETLAQQLELKQAVTGIELDCNGHTMTVAIQRTA
jgi:isoleucyl-tRNA synthetase